MIGSLKFRIKKFIRFVSIYGVRRTAVKSLARLNIGVPVHLLNWSCILGKGERRIWFFGCGHHALTCLAYFSANANVGHFVGIVDPSESSRELFRKFYRVGHSFSDFDQSARDCLMKGDYVFIASDHKSHASYAIECLRLGCNVHVEKPICIDRTQLDDLNATAKRRLSSIVTGFNRPFSEASRNLLKYATQERGCFSCSWTVLGHKLPDNHWYRDEGQGTRVLGNLSHWIDFAVFLFFRLERVPNSINCSALWSDSKKKTDNMVLSFRSDLGDLYSINFASHGEPFEGVRENCIFSRGEFISVISDFRRQTLEIADRKILKKYYPKDVGHREASMQMFKKSIYDRGWREARYSAALVLFVESMIVDGMHEAVFRLEPAKQN